jgi:hypothetical protein
MKLNQSFANDIALGLKRQSIITPSEWACTYRMMGGRSFPGLWKFKYHPWLKELHDSKAEINVGMKAAQMGYTETMLNIVFFQMDMFSTDCLYILPSKTPDASDFSAARFDSALQLSEHIANMFSNVKNVGHKKAGSANLYIRGSQSKAGLRSIPVGCLIVDEMSIINQEAIALVLERLSGQLEKLIWMISTPTIEDENIDKEFNKSTKEHFNFKCPRCGRYEELDFKESLVITADDITDPDISKSHYICRNTKLELPFIVSDDSKTNADAKANWISDHVWVPEYKDRHVRGFQIPQLYSCTVKPSELAISYLKGKSDPTDEQEFYNSKLGVTHAVKGAKITDDILNKVMGSHSKYDQIPKGLKTMGIDVGNICNVEIDEWYLEREYTPDYPDKALCKNIYEAEIETFKELDELMGDYGIHFCVIDSQPERRAALAFAHRHFGKVKLAIYAKGINGKMISSPENDAEHLITVNKTTWFDIALGRFKKETISLPYDTSTAYKDQLKAPTRIYERDSDGNPVGRYPKTSKPDHFANSRTYSEIALHLLTGYGANENAGKVL